MTINWMGWLLSAIMLLLLFVMSMLLKRPVRLMFTGKRTEGVVTGLDKKDGVLSPVVQFTASAGKQVSVSSRNYSIAPAVKAGDRVTVLYDEADPADAQILMWREFTIAGLLLISIAVILLLWISGLLVDPSAGLDDPFHILSSVIVHFRLSPWRLPVLFLLACAITTTGLGSWFNFKSSFDLRFNGIKVTGHITETGSRAGHTQDGRAYSSKFAMISFADLSGTTYTIRESLWVWSGVQEGDTAEVIYLPGNPGMGRANTWEELYFMPGFFVFMFLAFIVMLLLILNGNIRLQ